MADRSHSIALVALALAAVCLGSRLGERLADANAACADPDPDLDADALVANPLERAAELAHPFAPELVDAAAPELRDVDAHANVDTDAEHFDAHRTAELDALSERHAKLSAAENPHAHSTT